MAWRVEFFHEPSDRWIPLSMRVRTQAEADWIVKTLLVTQGLQCRVRVLEQELALEPDPEPPPIARPVVTTTLTSVVRHAPHPDPPPPDLRFERHVSGQEEDPRRCLKASASGRRCGQWRGEHPSFCAFHRPTVVVRERPVPRGRPVTPQTLSREDCWQQPSETTYAVTGTMDTFYEEETALYRDTAALNWPHGRIRTRVRRTNEEMPGRAVGRWRNFRHE